MKIVPAIFGGSLALAVVLLSGLPAANASTSTPSNAEATQEQACWKDVITKQSACAPTQEELAAKVYIEHGVEFVDQEIPSALVLSSSEKSLLTSNQRSAPSAPLSLNAVNATYLLGIYYSGAGYAGSSETMTATQSSAPCATYGNYTYGNVPNLRWTGFQDNIESFKGYGMCGLTLYADTNYAGSSYGPSAAASSLGAMANQASSIRVFKTS